MVYLENEKHHTHLRTNRTGTIDRDRQTIEKGKANEMTLIDSITYITITAIVSWCLVYTLEALKKQ